MKKKLLSLLLAFAVLSGASVSGAFTSEKNITARKVVHTVSPGLVYTEAVELCDGIRQEVYSFEFTRGMGTEIVPAYGKYIYGFNSVGQMIKSYSGEGRIVGGINTDFYITSTGIPLSCLVKDGEIITSCDGRTALGFDEEGNAVIDSPGIKSELYSPSKDHTIPIAHINKTPGIWGVYLITDTFYSDTKSLEGSVEIVLAPYEDKNDVPLEDDAVSDDNIISASEAETEAESEIKASEETADSTEAISVTEDTIITEDITEESGIETTEHIEPVETEVRSSRGIFDIIHQGFENGYTTSDTEGNQSDYYEADVNKEGITDDEAINAENESVETEISFDNYAFSDIPISCNSEIKVVIKEIRRNTSGGEIPEGCYVACVPGDKYDQFFYSYSVGDELILRTTASDAFDGCINIFGAGTVIVDDGARVEQGNDSIFRNRNPRTAAGIKEDGSVVFVCVDGRRSGVSVGYTITELSDYLISLGCVKAVNFDGGGSTTFYCADLGEENASLKNKPSDGVERRVADGLIFVNVTDKTETATNASLYPSDFITYFKGTETPIEGEVLFADENYHPTENPYEAYTLYVDPTNGEIKDGVFYPNGTAGTADIYLIGDDSGEAFVVGSISVRDVADKFTFTADKKELSPFESSAALSLSASHSGYDLNIGASSPEWNIHIKSDDESENIQALENQAYISLSESSFNAVERGRTYIITATVGGITKSVEIKSIAYPFPDAENHWSAKTTYDMYKRGLFIGEEHDGIMLFMPERNMTRAEFCTVLSRVLELDTSLYNPEEEEVKPIITDVPEWAMGAVNALYEAGYIGAILSDNGDGTLSVGASEMITRMDVIRVLGGILAPEASAEDFGENSALQKEYFSDFSPEYSGDTEYLGAMVSCNIMQGYEDGTIRQSANLTRAEAATVFSRFCTFTENKQ